MFNSGMNSWCRWRHLLTLGVGEMSIGDCKVGLVKLEVKLGKNSINLIVSQNIALQGDEGKRAVK